LGEAMIDRYQMLYDFMEERVHAARSDDGNWCKFDDIYKFVEWQPIETAPKGARILIATPVLNSPSETHEARWKETDPLAPDGCFSTLNGFIVFPEASHWMPLPEPNHD